MNFIGRKILIRYESGLEVEAHYKSATELTWGALTGPSKGTSGSETIYSSEVAPGVFFISWLENNGVSVSNVLDLNNRRMEAFVTFDAGKGRQSFFDKGVVEEIGES
ncbi:MAG TPA: phenolic acid decarboxylase [Blastocatellia bacterium]|nr:phenolic acid decarboxylase [Blastocatellia bacterium]